MKDHRHGNKISIHGPDRDPPTVRKVPASSVFLGDSISRDGMWVWVAYDAQGTLIAVAATSAEVRRKYRDLRRVRGTKS